LGRANSFVEVLDLIRNLDPSALFVAYATYENAAAAVREYGG
jgi:hypothetical protein